MIFHPESPYFQSSRDLVLEELRRSHSHQVHLVGENDDKAETIMRLGVFAVTGVAVFLTYAVRPDASLLFPHGAKLMFMAGALLQVLSFYTVLESYGVIGEARALAVGTDLASRRGALDRPREEVEDVVVSEYRKAIKANLQTYARMSRLLSFSGFTLFMAALVYFVAIYITVNP